MNFQESMTILNASTKRSGNLLNAPHKLDLENKKVLPVIHEAVVQL